MTFAHFEGRDLEQLEGLQERVVPLGAVIEVDDLGADLGFWLLNIDTLEGVWDDDNYSTTIDELECKVELYEQQKGAAA